MPATHPANSHAESLLSDLTSLLAKATVTALRAASKQSAKGTTGSRLFIGPKGVFDRLSTKSSAFTRAFSTIVDAKNWLQEDGRTNPVDLFVVFHPSHRVVPSPLEYGGPFRLSAALERDDHVWLIRPQSFLLQLLEDEYLLFPQTDEENAIWPGATEFWWRIRETYWRRGIPLRRGNMSSGWAELALNLVETLFYLERIETPELKIIKECSFAELVLSDRFIVLHDTICPLKSFPELENFVEEVQRAEELTRVRPFHIEANVTRFQFDHPNLLLANLVEDLSEQRNLLSGALLQSLAQSGIDHSTPEPIQEAIARLLTLIFPHSPGSRLSRSHSNWLRRHCPSFAVVRWHPLGHAHPEPLTLYAEGEIASASLSVQHARMAWYLRSEKRKGFTSRFVSGSSSYPNVGVDYGPFIDEEPPQAQRLLRPWILTTDFDPFQEALKMVRPYLIGNLQAEIDRPALEALLDRAIERTKELAFSKPLSSAFYLHYLLWYYECFLGHEFLNEKGDLADLDWALQEALMSMIPVLAFPEQHFHALTASVTTELVAEKERPKMITLSLGFAGEPLSSAELRMIHRVVDKLAELRTSDDALFRERQLRGEIGHRFGYQAYADTVSRERLRSDVELLSVARPSTVNLASLYTEIMGGERLDAATVILESEELAENFRGDFQAVLREARAAGARVYLLPGREARADQEHVLEFRLAPDTTFLHTLAEKVQGWFQIQRSLWRTESGISCRLHIPSVPGRRTRNRTRLWVAFGVSNESSLPLGEKSVLLLRAYATACILDRALAASPGGDQAFDTVQARCQAVWIGENKPHEDAVPVNSSQFAVAQGWSSGDGAEPDPLRVEHARLFLADIEHNLGELRALRDQDDLRRAARRQLRWTIELLEQNYAPFVNCDLYDVLGEAVQDALVLVNKYRKFDAVQSEEWKAEDSTSFRYTRPKRAPKWSKIRCRRDFLRVGLVQLLVNALRHAEPADNIHPAVVKVECDMSEPTGSSTSQAHEIRIGNTTMSSAEFLREHKAADEWSRHSQPAWSEELKGLQIAYMAFKECGQPGKDMRIVPTSRDNWAEFAIRFVVGA